MQIIVPFEPSQNDDPVNFMLPQLERGESISAMIVSEDDMALGTSQCRILQFKMAGYDATVTQQASMGSSSAGFGKEFTPTSPARSPGSVKSMARLPPRQKQPIESPSYVPPLPALSLDPSLLQSDNPNIRNGINDRIKSIFTAYTPTGEPTLTPLTGPNASHFGSLTTSPLLLSSKRQISPQLEAKAVTSKEGDFLMTIPTSALEVDLLESHTTKKQNKPHHNHRKGKEPSEPIPNPNKTIHARKIHALCYQEHQKRGHKSGKGAGTVSRVTLRSCQNRNYFTILSSCVPSYFKTMAVRVVYPLAID